MLAIVVTFDRVLAVVGTLAAVVAAGAAIRAAVLGRAALDATNSVARVETERWNRAIQPRPSIESAGGGGGMALISVSNPGGAVTDAVVVCLIGADAYATRFRLPAHCSPSNITLNPVGPYANSRSVDQTAVLFARDEAGRWWDVNIGELSQDDAPPTDDGNALQVWYLDRLATLGVTVNVV